MNHYNNAYLRNIYSQHACTSYKDQIDEEGWAETWDDTPNVTRRNLFIKILESDWLSEYQKTAVRWFLEDKGLYTIGDYPNWYMGQWEEIYWRDIEGLLESMLTVTGKPAICYSLSGAIAEDNSSED